MVRVIIAIVILFFNQFVLMVSVSFANNIQNKNVTAVEEKILSDSILVSLDDCVGMALTNVLTIKQKEYDLKAAGYEIERKRAIWDPVLRLNLDKLYAKAPSFSTLPGTATQITRNLAVQSGITQNLFTGGNYSLTFNSLRNFSNAVYQFVNPYYQTNLNLSVRQPLLKNFGSNNGGYEISIARNNKEISNFELNDEIEATVLSVNKAYWDFVYAYTKLKIEERALKQAGDIQGINEAKLEKGQISLIDVLRTNEKFLKHQADLISAQTEFETSESILKKMISLSIDDPRWFIKFVPMSELEQLVHPEYDFSNIKSAYAEGIEHQKEYLIKKKEIENQEILVRKTKNQMLPSVDLILGGGLNGLSDSYSSSVADLHSNQYYAWEAGIAVSMPLFNKDARNSAREAKISLERKKMELEEIRIAYFTKLNVSIRKIKNIQQKIKTSSQLKASAEEGLTAEREKLRHGLTSTSDLLDFLYELKGIELNAAKDIVDNNVEISYFTYLVGHTQKISDIRNQTR
jgi:outer membrane protein TolC